VTRRLTDHALERRTGQARVESGFALPRERRDGFNAIPPKETRPGSPVGLTIRLFESATHQGVTRTLSSSRSRLSEVGDTSLNVSTVELLSATNL
jgi:hypothetical protein